MNIYERDVCGKNSFVGPYFMCCLSVIGQQNTAKSPADVAQLPTTFCKAVPIATRLL